MGYYGLKEKGHAVIMGSGQLGRMVTHEIVRAGRK